MARILVTGASGFIGRSVIDALADGTHELHAVSRRPFRRGQVTHHELDLFDSAGVEELLDRVRPSHVLHAAWYAEHRSFWDAPENWMWFRATTSLARTSARFGVERFVGVGSVAEYDWSAAPAEGFAETTPLRPSTIYGRSKAATFEALSEADDLGQMSFAWGRLFHVFGAGEPPAKVTSYIARELLAGRAPDLRQPDAVYDFLDVHYVGEALAALLLGQAGGAVNVARGCGTRVGDLAECIARLLGVDPGKIVRHASLTDGVTPLVGNVSRLREDIGLPAPVPMEQSLAFVRDL